jgi:transcriptional regulator with XRE-family HTH domain
VVRVADEVVSGIADIEGGCVTMSDLEQLLGVDRQDPVQDLAVRLTEADTSLVRDLVAFRKAAGLTQDEVAKRMGRSQSVVSDIESMENDPRLSTLRRYALAIGALVTHVVDDYEAPSTPTPILVVGGSTGKSFAIARLRAALRKSRDAYEWRSAGSVVENEVDSVKC